MCNCNSNKNSYNYKKYDDDDNDYDYKDNYNCLKPIVKTDCYCVKTIFKPKVTYEKVKTLNYKCDCGCGDNKKDYNDNKWNYNKYDNDNDNGNYKKYDNDNGNYKKYGYDNGNYKKYDNDNGKYDNDDDDKKKYYGKQLYIKCGGICKKKCDDNKPNWQPYNPNKGCCPTSYKTKSDWSSKGCNSCGSCKSNY